MHPEKHSVLEELDRVTASEGFRDKPVMRKFLTYVVTEYVEGRSDKIKGYSIGLDVFGQDSVRDPIRGAIVRNNALRLRSLLETYYLGEGRTDPIVIEIPKGRYVPRFRTGKNEKADASGMDNATAHMPRDSERFRKPAVAVLPFSNYSRDPALDYLAIGFSQALCDALTKFDDFRVVGMDGRGSSEISDSGLIDEIRNKGIHFAITGEIQAFGSQVRISFQLIRSVDDSQIWSDSVRFDVEKDDLFDVQEAISARIASHIGGEYGHINRSRFQAMLNSRPTTLREQDILLKHYHHVAVLTEESAKAFKQAVLEGLEKYPESALINACAAGIYTDIWTLGLPGDDEAVVKAVHYAEKAYDLNPNHTWVVGSMGSKCFHFDERDRFFRLFEQSKEWLANSPLRLGAWAMWICYFGEWERGMKLLDQVFENNLRVPLWLYGVTCMNHYRNHDYETALVEADRIQMPGVWFGPALRTVASAQLGRLTVAEEEYEVLLECRPDFEEKGRRMLSCQFKEDSLLELVLEGFGKIGVKIA